MAMFNSYVKLPEGTFQALDGESMLPSGKRLHVANWKITMFNGNTPYFYGHFQ